MGIGITFQSGGATVEGRYNKCQECGTPTKNGRYCSKECEQKAWRKSHTRKCKVCGKEYVAGADIVFSGPHAHGCCSEECQRKARLQHEKPIAEKTLKKWEKELAKRQKKLGSKIDKLKMAIRSNDPEAMLVARAGGEFKRACDALLMLLRLIAFLIFMVGLIKTITYCRNVVNYFRTESVVVETLSETGASTLQEEKPDSVEPSLTPDSAVIEQNVSNPASAPIEQ